MNNGKILIIDDKPDNMEIFMLHLMSTNYEILGAPQGIKAQEILRSENNSFQIGLIFCDILMPQMNGLEILDILTNEFPWIPVVVITGYPDLRLKGLAKEKGAKDYLLKPLEKKNLLETVDKFFEANKEMASCI